MILSCCSLYSGCSDLLCT